MMNLLRRLPFFKLGDLSSYEKKVYSQNGEDGVIEAILKKIGTTNKYFVEYGVENGVECNTKYLLENGWSGLMMDGNPGRNKFNIKREYITAENINSLLKKYHVPKEPDLISIDIDSNDYWVWKATKGYKPRVLIMEYNASVSVNESKTVNYDPRLLWQGTNYFGASLLALVKLNRKKGYSLVYCEKKGVNAFFIRDDIYKRHFKKRDISDIYRPPRYGRKIDGVWRGHPKDKRKMIDV